MQDVLCVWFGSSGFDRSAEGLLGAGQRIAATTKGKLHSLVLGKGDNGSRAAAIADSVQIADQLSLDAYSPEEALAVITSVAKSLSPGAVLFANDAYSQELAPRLAYRLGGSAIGDAADVVAEGDILKVTRSVYGGKAVAVYHLERRPSVAWIRARAQAAATPRSTQAEIKHIATSADPNAATRLLERQTEAHEGVRLEDARWIISGGRGLGGPEPFEQLKELADTIGAQVAASRAACDAGWVPPSWQVGQTGKRVAPDLYLAVAISGASQHLIGIADAKVVAAINTDQHAPIFKHCQFGIVEDYKKVVSLLKEKLQALKG
ncbi:electron transfer flavoprotein subunit alpha/FixB family protein [bacterium]|nr:electron transfer flavoprotein subunit alpha/FixB family protein [bacterium]